MHDSGIISADASDDVIDRIKIKRSTNDIKKEINACAKINDAEIQSLYFDGKKNQTLINEKSERVITKKYGTIEEHITLIAEPGSNYLDHVSVSQGPSKYITKAILDFFEDKKCSTDSMQAVNRL